MSRKISFVLKRTALPNYYKVLGVLPIASQVQIHGAYLALAKQYHPDVGGDVAQMTLVTEAYSMLRSPEHRKQYDDRRRLLTKLCGTCKGAGVVYKTKGFTQRIASLCPACKGSGTQGEN